MSTAARAGESTGIPVQLVFKLQVKGKVVKRLTREVQLRQEELERLQKELDAAVARSTKRDKDSKWDIKRNKEFVKESQATLQVTLQALVAACAEAAEMITTTFSTAYAKYKETHQDGEHNASSQRSDDARSLNATPVSPVAKDQQTVGATAGPTTPLSLAHELEKVMEALEDAVRVNPILADSLTCLPIHKNGSAEKRQPAQHAASLSNSRPAASQGSVTPFSEQNRQGTQDNGTDDEVF